MRHLDLFSGIGGFALAAQWMGWETVQFVEIDKFCQKVLNKNFPNVPIHGDIKTFDGSKYRGTVDIITGGFPCQDLSVASSNGKKGFNGEKSGLYKHIIRLIRETKPTHVVIENVYGLVAQDNGEALETLCTDLAIEGFETIPLVLYASSFGANHHRPRFFSYSTRERNWLPPWKIQAGRNIIKYGDWWSCEPGIRRMDDGVPNRVDRIKSLGNSVVPQVAFEIFKAIDSVRFCGVNS